MAAKEDPSDIGTLIYHDTYGHLFHDPEEDVELMAKMESDLLAA